MPTALRPSSRQSDGYVPFADRFKAWWHGQGPTEIRPADGGPAAPDDIVVDAAEQPPAVLWPPERIALVQRLWGDGSSQPGGAQYTLELVRPFNLLPEMTVLDLATGLGAGTRAISEQYGVWIAAMDGDANLTDEAADYLNRKGASKVDVSCYDPAAIDLPTAKYDCILVREQLCFLRDREQALAAISKALKPGGQIILTDYVAAKPPDDAPKLAEWSAKHGLAAPLWSAKAYRNQLTELGLDVRIFQDDSADIHKLILAGWAQFVDGLSRAQLNRTFVDTMILEAETWLSTVRAIEAQELRYLRVHVLAKPEIV